MNSILRSVRPLPGLAALLLASVAAASGQSSSAPRHGPYFAQPSPGDAPVLFAPGIVAIDGRVEERIAFSPDGRECFFNVTTLAYKGFTLYHARQQADGTWSAPAVAAFATGDYSYCSPAFSGDGQRLFFTSNRPYPGQVAPVCRSLWFAERRGDAWSEPQFLGPAFARAEDFAYVSLTTEGVLYFIGYRRGPEGRTERTIYRSRPMGGGYAAPEPLNAALHSAAADLHDPFIASDGSFLLFNRDEIKSVCFHRADDTWSEPVAIEEPLAGVTGKKWALSVSPDRQYLFFSNWPAGPEPHPHIYWRDAHFLAALSPTAP